ncbi:hypothetical protein H0H92_006784 [Tricholoma furcatifolium]|nr:hypothetical protein H0H92_006784 [Tricholoma furcatifolium]
MGNTQSLLYPDNPNRRARAQQLADDCQLFQNKYEQIKKEVEDELGPYTNKMQEVLKAFGCHDLNDLDQLVKETATKQGLQQWQEIKSSVDGLSQLFSASDVISTAMAVVAIAGIVISAIGALAGGFGFIAGMAATSSILSILGVVGLIFDVVTGAIQRSELQDAINALFKLRIEISFLAQSIELIKGDIGAIKRIYAIFEKQGYDKDKIIQELRESDTLVDLQKSTAKITYLQVARCLLQMDETRLGGSWRNEDPNLEDLAKSLDAGLEAKKGIANSQGPVRKKRSVGSPDSYHSFQMAPELQNSMESEKRLLALKQDGKHYVTNNDAVSISVIFTATNSLTPALRGTITIILKEIVNETSAVVQLKNADHRVLEPDLANRTIETSTALKSCDWVISFSSAAQAHDFATLTHDAQSAASLGVYLRADTKDSRLYLCADGKLKAVGDNLTVKYAQY